MTFRAKANLCGGLERHKVGCAIGRDGIRPLGHFDEHRTASHMPSQAGARILLAGAAAINIEVESWDVRRAYVYAPGNPNFRVTMTQPARSPASG